MSSEPTCREELTTQQDEKKIPLDDDHESGTRTITDRDLRRLYRKVDLVILPVIWLCQGVQQADKLGLATQAT